MVMNTLVVIVIVLLSIVRLMLLRVILDIHATPLIAPITLTLATLVMGVRLVVV